MSVAISGQTNEALMRVMRFFGIDDYHRQLSLLPSDSDIHQTPSFDVELISTVRRQ